MLVAWRIVKGSHAATAFTGEGTAKFGGRWNSRGYPLVYTSATESLAALELRVHLNKTITCDYMAFRIEFDESLVEEVGEDQLEPQWNNSPPGPSSQRIGDDWVRAGRSAVLRVPSVLIASESNYLLNPNHADFGKIIIGKPKDFMFDPRLK